MKQLKDGDINEIIAKINIRPGKELNFQLPIRVFQLLVVKLRLLVEFVIFLIKVKNDSFFYIYSLLQNSQKHFSTI